jgi:hypothetical protein
MGNRLLIAKTQVAYSGKKLQNLQNATTKVIYIA